eukprot:1157186-Pelagomonas_calceolata.AAC.5
MHGADAGVSSWTPPVSKYLEKYREDDTTTGTGPDTGTHYRGRHCDAMTLALVDWLGAEPEWPARTRSQLRCAIPAAGEGLPGEQCIWM